MYAQIVLTHYNVFTYWSGAHYKTKIKDVHKLQERIVDERDKLDQRIIDKVTWEWHKRLQACVAAAEEQFEHKMWTYLIAYVLSCVIFEG